MNVNSHYPPQTYAMFDQSGRPPMSNLIPMGMQQPSQYPYQSQMIVPNPPIKRNTIQPAQQIMMTSPYQGQPMNMYAPMNVPLQSSAMAKSRTSMNQRKNLGVSHQEQWYPQQTQGNPQFMINQPQTNVYDMRPHPTNISQNHFPQMTNFTQRQITGNMAYPPIPVGYNMASQNIRPQKINNAQSTIPNLPMVSSYPQAMNQHQALNNHPMMNNPQMNANSYGPFGRQSGIMDRPQSSQIQSRPSSAGSQLSMTTHQTSFKTGVSFSGQSGRSTPVEKKMSMTTRQRYLKNSKGSLAALDYETYDLEDWKRQKNRDENMKLPSGLGHTETNEWKTKHDKMNRMQQYSQQVRQRAKQTLY